MPRKISWRAVKRHRSYTVDETARTLGTAKGTVRRWIKSGLPALTDQKPALILGEDLIDYLQHRKPAKQTCKLDECFCFSCKAPKKPALGEVEFFRSNAKTGSIRALCETCCTVMHKRISNASLNQLRTSVSVTCVDVSASNWATASTSAHTPNQ